MDKAIINRMQPTAMKIIWAIDKAGIVPDFYSPKFGTFLADTLTHHDFDELEWLKKEVGVKKQIEWLKSVVTISGRYNFDLEGRVQIS